MAGKKELLETVHSGGRLLTDILSHGCHTAILGVVGKDRLFQQLQNVVGLRVYGALWVRKRPILRICVLDLFANVDQQGRVSAVGHALGPRQLGVLTPRELVSS